MNLPYLVDRSVVIQAQPETVFRFFTDSARWASWWGAGSTIEPKLGGKIYILHPGKIEVVGEVMEIDAPRRIVFTYGYPCGKPIPVGGSRVSIRLEAVAAGTKLLLEHHLADESLSEFVQGWRYQLSLFGNVVADEVNAGAEASVDAWFRAWAVTDAAERATALHAIAEPEVRFRDRFSLVEGIDDLNGHLIAVQRFMPGIRLERRGTVRHCQGTVLADWAAVGAEGKEVMSGTNVFVFGAKGKMLDVIGIHQR